MHYRTSLRADVRGALADAVDLVSYEVLRGWAVGVSAEDLPVMCVITPNTSHAMATGNEQDNFIDLIVLAKRSGDQDIEDQLDDDAALIEVAVIPVLAAASDMFGLVTTSVEVDGEGVHRIGTLQMSFRVLVRTPEGDPN
jgi:hypothetical protein